MNRVVIVGNLAADPETRTTQSGISQCSFRVAVSRRYTNQQTGVRETDYFPVVAWRQLADNCAKYLSKGKKVAVEGTLQTRNYEGKDGIKRYVTEIMADNVEFLTPKGESQYQASAPAQAVGAADTESAYDDDDDLPF